MEVAMATEKQTTHQPVSRMTPADLNRKNQAFHDSSGGDEAGSMMSKEQQLEPGSTVHNSRGLKGKVIRVQGGRVVVRCPDGSEDTWELTKTFRAADAASAESEKARLLKERDQADYDYEDGKISAQNYRAKIGAIENKLKNLKDKPQSSS
jgi:preprotein translocase subunit YajC